MCSSTVPRTPVRAWRVRRCAVATRLAANASTASGCASCRARVTAPGAARRPSPCGFRAAHRTDGRRRARNRGVALGVRVLRFVVFALRMLGTSSTPIQTRASSFPTRLRPLDTRRSSDPGRAWERDSNCLERGAPCQTTFGCQCFLRDFPRDCGPPVGPGVKPSRCASRRSTSATRGSGSRSRTSSGSRPGAWASCGGGAARQDLEAIARLLTPYGPARLVVGCRSTWTAPKARRRPKSARFASAFGGPPRAPRRVLGRAAHHGRGGNGHARDGCERAGSAGLWSIRWPRRASCGRTSRGAGDAPARGGPRRARCSSAARGRRLGVSSSSSGPGPPVDGAGRSSRSRPGSASPTSRSELRRARAPPPSAAARRVGATHAARTAQSAPATS